MSEQRTARQRRSPVVWLAIIVVGIGVLAIVAGIIAYVAFRSSRSMPLAVPIYPDARQIGSAVLGTGHDRLRYASPSPAEEIGAFYNREIGCQRFDNSAPSPDQPAFEYRCVADGSSLFITQYTRVTVQPGVGEYAGQTLIDMDRVWGQ